jgi:uncharacterized protein YlxP (DUF503 family)
MVVGVCTFELHLPGVASLKGKRQILLSLKGRIQNKFNVSIAEVDGQDLWQTAVLGVACVANEQRHTNEVLDSVLNVVRANPDVELVRQQMEFL